MPNNEIDWSPILPDAYYPEDHGDGAFGYARESDRVVGFTRFGEFSVNVGEQGELIAIFARQGLVAVYEQEGDLSEVMVNLELYFRSLPEETLDRLPNGGESVRNVLALMAEEEITLAVDASFRSGEESVLTVILVDKEGEKQVLGEIKDADFSKGIRGDMDIEGSEITYEIVKYGDDLFIALGEGNQNGSAVCPIELSLFVDFEEDLLTSEDPRRLQRLAEKIILD